MNTGTTFHYIRRSELLALLGHISRSKLEQMVSQGLIPAPFRLGARAVAWRSDEIEKAMSAFSRAEALVYGTPVMRRTR